MRKFSENRSRLPDRNVPPLLITVSKDLFLDDCFHGLKTSANLRVFRVLCLLRMKFVTPSNPNPEIYMKTEYLERACKVSKNTFHKAKQLLQEKRYIDIRISRQYRHGSCCHIRITEAGLAAYWKIQAERQKEKPIKAEPVEKQKIFTYSSEDVEVAKYWFRNLRKFWNGYQTKMSYIGNWNSCYEERANTIRKCRKKLNCSSQEIGSILRAIINSDQADFFLTNVIASGSLIKKWSNGLTVIENMQMKVQELQKKQSQADKLILSEEKDLPVYETSPGSGQYKPDPEVTSIWTGMWKILDGRLKIKYKNQKEQNVARTSLQELCEHLADFLYMRPGRIVLKESRLRYRLLDDSNPDANSYFYFLLDKYSGWNGYFTPEMIWSPWLQFWKKIWKLDHGDPTDADMEQFIVEQFTEER